MNGVAPAVLGRDRDRGVIGLRCIRKGNAESENQAVIATKDIMSFFIVDFRDSLRDTCKGCHRDRVTSTRNFPQTALFLAAVEVSVVNPAWCFAVKEGWRTVRTWAVRSSPQLRLSRASLDHVCGLRCGRSDEMQGRLRSTAVDGRVHANRRAKSLDVSHMAITPLQRREPIVKGRTPRPSRPREVSLAPSA